MKPRPLLLLLGLFALAPAGSASAQSQQIPYQGRLDLDGVPMNGRFNFLFELYNHLTDGDCAASPRPSSCLWADEYQGVEVKSGRFSVALGARTPIPTALWSSNDEVFLGIRVAAAGDPYSTLEGRQRLLSLPLAALAASAKNYSVTGDLAVGGKATVSGPVRAGFLHPASSTWVHPGTAQAGICNDTTGYKALMLVGNSSAGGSRRVTVYDDLYVPNGRVSLRDGPDLGLVLKTCSLASVTGGCFCDPGTFPLAFTVTCAGVGHMYYDSRYTKNAGGTYGVKGRCINIFNPWPITVVDAMQLLCSKVQQPSWPAIPTAWPWDF